MSKKRLKIGVVVDQLLPGGVQIAAIKEVENLRLLGHRAELLILMRKKYSFQFEYLVENVPHKYLSDSYPWPFRATIKFPIFAFFSTLHLLSPFLAPRVIKEGSYDILISHGTTTCFTTLALWHKRKIPYVALIHDPMVYILEKIYAQTILKYFFPLLRLLAKKIERSFLKDALGTIIDSKVHFKYLKETYGVEAQSITLGVKTIPQIPDKRGDCLLSFGRWQKEKNPTFLLKLLKALPRTKLIIAGSWTNQEDLEKFRGVAKKDRLERRIKIIPHFTDKELEKICAQARVWIHPHFEAFSLAALEAAGHGLPIIIPQKSGVTEIFEHGREGFFPENISLPEYRNYIKRLFTNERLAYEMGKTAWEVVRKNYSWEAHTQRLINLTHACLKNLATPQITAIEIGHAGGTGLSGGDKLFEEMVKKMPKKFKFKVITSPFGSYHWQESNLGVDLQVLSPNPFETKPDPISVFLSYFIRMIQTATLLLFRMRGQLQILYSSTNILPDIMPAFFAKIFYPKVVWIARIHHLIPPPQEREGKLIVNIVSYFMQKLSLFCMRYRANLTIALNEALYKHLIKIGFSKNRLAVLEAGIDFKRISEYQPKKTESFDGIYLGRLHIAKGVFDTIDIWKEVTRREKKAKLAIIGAGPQYVKSELESQIIKERLTRNIEILGYLPEDKIYDYLKSAKVFLFTDHEAGWGLAIAEAMACKLPIVGYNIGILGDVYKEGFRVVKLGDISGFAKKICDLLENQGQREKLAQLAFTGAKNLDWQKTAEKFAKIVNILKNGSPPFNKPAQNSRESIP